MTAPRPSGEADRLLNHPILVGIFADLEKTAVERAINAKLGDDETRRNSLAEARAIRSVRQQLSLAAQGKIKLAGDTSE